MPGEQGCGSASDEFVIGEVCDWGMSVRECVSVKVYERVRG